LPLRELREQARLRIPLVQLADRVVRVDEPVRRERNRRVPPAEVVAERPGDEVVNDAAERHRVPLARGELAPKAQLDVLGAVLRVQAPAQRGHAAADDDRSYFAS